MTWIQRTLLVLLALLPALALAAQGSRDDERFLAGLRERRLFDLAEKYCADRLADADLSDEERLALTLEQSRTLAEHAQQADANERPALWRQAREVVEQFAAGHPKHPRLLLARAQGALAAAAAGQAAREEAELAASAQATQAARTTLRESIAELRKVDEQIAQAIAGQSRAGGQAALSLAELQSLQFSLKYQLAVLLRNQGLSYAAGSADRINSLTQAAELLAQLEKLELEPALAWQCRFEELACLRLLGEYGKASEKLAQLEKLNPSGALAGRLQAERILLALARGQLDEALAEAGAAATPTRHPLADFARLEAYLAAWTRAGERHNAEEASKWEQAAIEQARAMGRDYGPAWMRKAEGLLARSIATGSGGESAEMLARAGDSFYRGGQLDRALATYDEAAKRARGKEQADVGFEIAYKAAAIEKQRGKFREATDRFRSLSVRVPENPRAAEAHLLAVHCAAQLAQQQQPPKLDEYEQLLREHVATWAKQPTASQAWWWLGRLQEHRRNWPEAIRALRNVAADHPQHAAAVEALAGCYATALAEKRQHGGTDAALAREASAYFEKILEPGLRAKATWTPSMRAAALAAARIRLAETPANATAAQRVLERALLDGEDAPPPWKNAARSLLVPALAAQGQFEKAVRVLEQLPIAASDDALVMLELLADQRERAEGDERRKLAELEVSALDDLLGKADELPPAVMRRLALQRVQALVASNQRGQAAAGLQTLAVKFPRDGQLQEELATLLGESGETRDLQAALAKWREVAGKSRPGSPRWFRAQYGLARTQLNLGNAANCRATIKLLQASHPDLGGQEMHARFQKLLAESERSAQRGK